MADARALALLAVLALACGPPTPPESAGSRVAPAATIERPPRASPSATQTVSHHDPTVSRSPSGVASPRRARGSWRIGTCSWYGGAHHGRATASGERFDQWALTAAHRRLAFGTRVQVERLDRYGRPTGDRVVVRITDRGPAAWTGHDLDLSRGAFERLAPATRGVLDIRWRVLR